jgi:hypothetical protein
VVIQGVRPSDLVFIRLLICHMTDQTGVLRRLWSWVKPGDVLLVQDYDMGIMHSAPASPMHAEGFDLVRQTFAATGKDPRAGTSMPHYFLKAGIGFPGGTLIAGTLLPSVAASGMLVAVLTSLTPAIVKLGLASASHMEILLSGIQTAAADPQATARIPDLIASWKRKPA